MHRKTAKNGALTDHSKSAAALIKKEREWASAEVKKMEESMRASELETQREVSPRSALTWRIYLLT